MSIIADFLAVMDKITKASGDANELVKKLGLSKGKSVANMADDALLQFRVFVTDAVLPERVMNTMVALEGEYQAFVQLSMGLNAEHTDASVAAYIRRFHQNTADIRDIRVPGGLSSGVGNYQGAPQQVIDIASSLSESLDSLYEGLYEHFDAVTAVEFSVLNENTRQIFHRASIKNLKEFKSAINTVILNEASNTNKLKNSIAAGTNSKNTNTHYESPMDLKNISNSNMTFNVNNGSGGGGAKPQRAQLMDTDVKKINRMNPTLLHMNVHVLKDGVHIPVEFTIGIKTVATAVPSAEMEKELVRAINRERKLFSFFKATTGEMNFFKDYLFAMDRIKDDALAASRNSWAESLRIRKKVSKLPYANILPNATIIVTEQELDAIGREQNMKVDEVQIRSIMRHYQLLGFVVMNSLTEVATFYFDNGSTQQYSYKALDAKKKDNGDNSIVASSIVKARS